MSVINELATFARAEAIRYEFNAAGKPFRYVVIERFLDELAAAELEATWPKVDQSWVDSNVSHQWKKYTQPVVAGTPAASFFDELATPRFLALLETITGMKGIVADPRQFGGGYHNVFDGGFLDVHVDFNKHDEHTGLDRRLNLILYLNSGWREEFGGCLELWDMAARRRIEKIVPTCNRAVLFETNEVSFHGHPEVVRTAGRTARKSLAAYYYTHGRDDVSRVAPHSTIYVNTHGLSGYARQFRATFDVLRKRLARAHGVAGHLDLARAVVRRAARLVRR